MVAGQEPIFQHIRRFVRLDDDEAEWLGSILRQRSLKKKQLLLKAGEVCKGNHFVVNGCLRMFCLTDKGTEQTVQFAIENWWMADLASLSSGRPSNFSIQAVEAAEVLILPKTQEEAVFARLPQMERYFRLIFQRALAASVVRIYYIFDQSGEERYHHFNDLFPDFVQRIPQYMLASYLGFTPEFLSKIRAKK